MSSILFQEPEPHAPRKLTHWVATGLAAFAVALAVAGCGGGSGSPGAAAGAAPPAAVSAQMKPVEAFALAQQSLVPPDDPAPAPVAPPNLLANAGFEAGMAHWTDWGNANVVSGQASTGTSALSVGTGAGGAGQRVAGIVPGNTYRLTAQAKVSTASEPVYVGVNFLDDQGMPFTQNSVLVTSTSYSTATLDVVAPPNAVSALVYVWKNAGSGVADVDDFALQSLGRAAPRLPSSANFVRNGGFELPIIVGWDDWGNADISGRFGVGAGSASLQVGTGAGGLGQLVGGITAGNTYRISALAKVTEPNEVGYLGVMFTDDAGHGLRAQNVVIRSTTFSMVQADVIAPPGATKALVFVWKNAGSGFAVVDEVSLVQVAPVSMSFTPVSASPTVLANGPTTERGVAVLQGGRRVAGWSDATGVHSQPIDAYGVPAGAAMLIAPSGTFSGIAALAGGGYVVEYDQPGAVLVQRVDATGALTGAPIIVRTQAQVEADLAALMDPALAGGAGVYPLAGGGFVALYRQSHTARIPGDVPISVAAQRFDALGSMVGTRTFIADEIPGRPSATAATPDGGLITGSMSICPCASGGSALFSVRDGTLQHLGSSGSPLESTTSQGGAGLGGDTYIGIWTSTSATPVAGQVKGQLFALDAGSLSGTRSLGPVLTFPQAGAGARVTALAGGGFLLSWGTSAQALNASGLPVSEVVQILDGSIAATPEGGFVVVAQVGGQLVEQEYVAAH